MSRKAGPALGPFTSCLHNALPLDGTAAAEAACEAICKVCGAAVTTLAEFSGMDDDDGTAHAMALRLMARPDGEAD